jgi:predicted nucleotidyltransferase
VDAIKVRLEAAEVKLRAGYRFSDLKLEDQLAVKAAVARGLPTIHED